MKRIDGEMLHNFKRCLSSKRSQMFLVYDNKAKTTDFFGPVASFGKVVSSVTF